MNDQPPHQPITLEQVRDYHRQFHYTESKQLVEEGKLAGQVHILHELETKSGHAPLHVSIVDNVYIVGKHALLLTQRGQVIRESVVYSHVDLAIKDVDLVEISEKNSFYMHGQFLPLCGVWSEGFWHWLMEYIPIILHAKLAGFNGFYMVAPYVPKYIIDTISLLGIGRNQLLIYDGTPWLVEKIFLPERLPASDTLFNYPGVIKLLRETLLHAAGVEQEAVKRKIYISRADAHKGRRILNEPALIQLLEKYGFDIVCMGTLSLREQINLMANTNVLVGPHGAGMAHCLFMPEKSLVIEIFSPQYIAPCMLPVVDYLKHNYHMALPIFAGKEYPHGQEVEANLSLIETILRSEGYLPKT